MFNGNGRPAVDEVRAALAPRYSVVPDGRTQTVRRTWLDTFDWRLHRAGLTLEHVTGNGPGKITLTTADGQSTTIPAGRVRWPAPAGALPDGPVRERLDQVARERALLPVARGASTVAALRACNADDKTVAWLTVDSMSATTPATADLPARLSVRAVRGYQGQADRISQRLACAPEMTPAGEPVLSAVLATGGRYPGDYTGRIDVELVPAMPARSAMAAVLAGLLDTLEANTPGTIADTDPEFLHDFRVSLRRTRTALKLGAQALPPGLAAQFAAEFKWLGDATTPVRDLDVYLLGFPAMTQLLTSAAPEDLAPFRQYLSRQRSVERRRLVRALRSARFTALTAGWREAITGLRPARRDPGAAALAAQVIAQAHRKVARRGSAITPLSPAENLHDLRKRCKELRYALEFFGSLCEPASHRQVVRDLKGLQDCLGTYQDCQVQQDEIRVAAAQMLAAGQAGAPTLLAMGDLSAAVGASEHRARAEFAGRFRDFASAANQRRLATMVLGVRP